MDLPRFVNILAVAITLAFSGALLAEGADAHGSGTLQLRSEPSGPYWVTVWTSPEPVRVGEMHVTIGVGDVDGAPILDAYVEVEIANLRDDGLLLSGLARTENSANKLLYEVDFELAVPGIYIVTVMVSGDEGYGSSSFDLEVLVGNSYDWVVVVCLVGCVVVFLSWWFFKRRFEI